MITAADSPLQNRSGPAVTEPGPRDHDARPGTRGEPPPASRVAVPLAGTGHGLAEVAAAVTRAACGALVTRHPRGPLPAGDPDAVLSDVTDTLGPRALPEHGLGTDAALHRVARVLVEHGIELGHPWAAAHLQPAPLAVAVAADTLASAGNASLDTYDSAASAIAVERWVIGVLAGLAGLGDAAEGVFTPGGSLSNLMALLLAREHAAVRRGVDVRRNGVAGLPNPVVLCSSVAHFSVHRACATLGLGEAAVRPVPVDQRWRMRPEALAAALAGLDGGHTPVAVVATAGTTDFGSVDPLPEIAEVAREHGTWLHVDAAYGFGALLSPRLAGRLAGLALADSVTVDLHKLGWQPASASALLVRDAAAFAALDRSVAYLNPADDAAAGYDGLLGRSLQTTRRPDAVKVAATLLAYGRRGLGQMVEHCHDLARHAERWIAAAPRLELVAPAELTTVVFRYRTADPALADEVNAALRRRLLRSGQALVGRTAVRPAGPGSAERTCLKLTLLNPNTTPRDLDDLLAAVVDAGVATEAATKGAA
ncbi:pyridoxal phosphate-dependent decarboxylase family protein [Gandjariella thermophila]|uniref:Aspartate aminotransferase family protein n=1 Tax=Gandjariella thermophila TaxID=1931992 RepID=A0A4D4IWX4_9PSEU|nr:aminotransferase class V-fold PLP-dependent enzyme [Gandjariella thermophila]GDY28845.1 aspartate aminotransferase family protein [Gandjariella thermophila]